MRFPVKNCYSKVIVSESLEIFWELLLLLLYSRISCLTIYGKLPNLVVLTR